MQFRIFPRVAACLTCVSLVCASSFVQAQSQGQNHNRGQGETAPAKLNALSRVQISSELAARIIDVRVRAGDRFSEGDLLARFDCTELKAELEGAASQRALARRQLDANISLRQLGGNISELEMVQSEAQLAEATANAKVLTHRHSQCSVFAPFDGYVISRTVEPHQRAEVGAPLFELVDNRGLEVEAIIPSGWLAKLSLGDQFQVTINETGHEYSATLQRIVPVVDPVTRTVRVIGKIEHEADSAPVSILLISGMSGEARFRLRDNTADLLADGSDKKTSRGAN
ncbi:efflux RND transporter periplasmic adaptor subunit [Microbulbifer hydrolyticus]|uniref:Efflux RND transporter periplasmic adaptor subunit n=1 Tax=Microbulbifer hydrolyticus TaxID=48074 RepID=A0A6P1TBX6_9GAMM|nr:efflux RND transporter periplasmic adaptor subunit [Microbulbifer hydrolyticus]MBB5212677.1 RND family efflux transporter MFP subunit [Microbulbifer hydrolyticus]QHQ40274.1 efflux RND transporter periplasmic adaptor subunit [Microbulbifer hydrolyticus]